MGVLTLFVRSGNADAASIRVTPEWDYILPSPTAENKGPLRSVALFETPMLDAFGDGAAAVTFFHLTGPSIGAYTAEFVSFTSTPTEDNMLAAYDGGSLRSVTNVNQGGAARVTLKNDFSNFRPTMNYRSDRFTTIPRGNLLLWTGGIFRFGEWILASSAAETVVPVQPALVLFASALPAFSRRKSGSG